MSLESGRFHSELSRYITKRSVKTVLEGQKST
jgi:hypothetical protein